MKKLFLLCIVLLTFIPAYSYGKSNIAGITLQQALNDDIISMDFNNDKKQIILSQIILLPKDDQYEEEDVIPMIQRIENIDTTILEALSNKGVKIKFFSGKLTDEAPFSHLKGVHPKGWSIGSTWDDVPGAGGTDIVAAKIGHSEIGNGHGSINLELHEVAHSVETIVFGYLRDDTELKEIWKKEVGFLFPGKEYFMKYPEEYFAEAFAMYYLNRSSRFELLEKAPETYEYIKSLENQVKNSKKYDLNL